MGISVPSRAFGILNVTDDSGESDRLGERPLEALLEEPDRPRDDPRRELSREGLRRGEFKIWFTMVSSGTGVLANLRSTLSSEKCPILDGLDLVKPSFNESMLPEA